MVAVSSLSKALSGIVASPASRLSGVSGGLGRASTVWQADDTMIGRCFSHPISILSTGLTGLGVTLICLALPIEISAGLCPLTLGCVSMTGHGEGGGENWMAVSTYLTIGRRRPPSITRAPEPSRSGLSFR